MELAQRRAGWLSPVLFLVATAHLFNDVYMGFLTPLYPIVMQQFGLDLARVGAVSMVAALASAFSQPLFGMAFDRFGITPALYLAPLLTGILISLVGVAPSYPAFLVLLFLGCLGSSAFHPKGASVAPTLSERPELGMAVFSAGGNLGFAAGPVLFALFVSIYGFRSTPVLAIPAAAVGVLLFIFLPANELRRRTLSAARVTWRALFQNRTDLAMLVRLVFINFALNVSLRGLQTFLPVYLSSLSVSSIGIGGLFTAALALGAIASVFASSLSRWTGKRLLILSSLIAGLPLALPGFLLMPSPAGVLLIILGSVIQTFTNPLLIFMAQRHSGGSPAMASSLIMGLSWGLAGLAMVPLGWIGELVGMKVMLGVACAFPLVALFAGSRLSRD